MLNIQEIYSKDKRYKAVILKDRTYYRIVLLKYYPETVDEDGDLLEEFWQEINKSNTITDSKENAIKLAKEQLSLFD